MEVSAGRKGRRCTRYLENSLIRTNPHHVETYWPICAAYCGIYESCWLIYRTPILFVYILK